jgi:hypothetical protein
MASVLVSIDFRMFEKVISPNVSLGAYLAESNPEVSISYFG